MYTLGVHRLNFKKGNIEEDVYVTQPPLMMPPTVWVPPNDHDLDIPPGQQNWNMLTKIMQQCHNFLIYGSFFMIQSCIVDKKNHKSHSVVKKFV